MDSVSIITHSDWKKELIYAPRVIEWNGIGEISKQELKNITITPTDLDIGDIKDWCKDKIKDFLKNN